MYQGIFYCRDEKQYYLRDDLKGIQSFKYYGQKYKLDEYGEYFTLFDERCSPIDGKFDWNDNSILEKDISKELIVLRDYYYETDDKPEYHNLVYLDIEIEILGALTPTTIREANAEITAIALIDVNTKTKYCLILDKKQNLKPLNQNNTEIIPCKTEKTLIKEFLKIWEKLDPTIISGYNSAFFDIPYLYFRIKKLLGDEVLRLSPINKITDNQFNPSSPITIGLVNHLDFMLLFQKFIMKEEPSYKLGDIGLKYANLGKIEYNGNLDKLFEEDPIKFIEYNIRDVEIIEKLEEKLGFIELAINISHIGHTPYESVFYNTVLNEGAILTYLKRKNIVSPNKPTTVNPSIKELNEGDEVVHQRGTPTIEGEVYKVNRDLILVKTKSGKFINRAVNTLKKKQGYAGGFLLEPKPGLYSWLSDYDYSSYYPSCIRSLNIGPETLIGYIDTPNVTKNLWMSKQELEEMEDEEIQLRMFDQHNYEFSKPRTLKASKLLNYIETQNLNISANGVLFRKDKKSILAEILGDWFELRQSFKAKMKEYAKEGDEDKSVFYDRYQHSFKIMLNSLYGALAVNGFRYTDGHKILSSAITCTCQRIMQETILYANQEMDKLLES